MLWVYTPCKYFNSVSAGTVFRSQNLTYTDVRSDRVQFLRVRGEKTALTTVQEPLPNSSINKAFITNYKLHLSDILFAMKHTRKHIFASLAGQEINNRQI